MKTIKVNVWESDGGEIFRTKKGSRLDLQYRDNPNTQYLATETIEIEIEPRMKIVTKELMAVSDNIINGYFTRANCVGVGIPKSAFNIRILFDIKVEE